VLEIHTTQPGMQLYTGNKLNGSVAGRGGVIYRQSAGFAFEPLMTPVVVASAGLAFAPGEVTATVFAATCVVQTIAALTAVRVLRGSWLSWRYIPLELVRSYVGLLCWMRACTSRRIEWRGHAFTMMRGTRIVPVELLPERPDRARLPA